MNRRYEANINPLSGAAVHYELSVLIELERVKKFTRGEAIPRYQERIPS